MSKELETHSGILREEQKSIKLDSIESAIEDIRNGKVIIVVDDEDRENEGDFICSAELVTSEIINFMAKEGRGLICTPIDERRADELNLPLMVRNNTSLHETAFTVSIDLIGQGCSTGISAYDRATGIKALMKPETKASDFARPGHIFPLRAKSGGVLQRTGHTEAAIDLARMAGLQPAGVLVEILNEDGTMARLPELFEKAQSLNLKIISIKDLIEFRLRRERLISIENVVELNSHYGVFKVFIYNQHNSNKKHIAFVKGNIDKDQCPLVRVQSTDGFTDVVDLIMKSEHARLSICLQKIKMESSGILLLMTQTDHLDGLMQYIEPGKERTSPNAESVQRDIGIGAQILKDLGVHKMRLLTTQPKKNIALSGYGLEIEEYVYFDVNP